MSVIARHYATQSLVFRTNIRGLGLGDSLTMVGSCPQGRREVHRQEGLALGTLAGSQRVRNLFTWWYLVHLPWVQLRDPSRSLLVLTRLVTPRRKAQSNYQFTSGGQSPSEF